MFLVYSIGMQARRLHVVETAGKSTQAQVQCFTLTRKCSAHYTEHVASNTQNTKEFHALQKHAYVRTHELRQSVNDSSCKTALRAFVICEKKHAAATCMDSHTEM